jgi:hypothetical protein
MRVVETLVLAAGLLVTACVSAKMNVDIPESPDMEPLVESYDFPDAPFSVDLLQGLVQQLQDNIELLQDLGFLPESGGPVDPVSLALAALSGEQGGGQTEGQQQTIVVHGDVESQSQAIVVGGEEVSGDGYVEVTRICDGWGDAAAPDAEANGTVNLTAVFSDQGFDAVIWGEATACKYRVGDLKLLLDGSVSVYTGDMLPQWDGTTFTTGQADELLVSFDGKVTATSKEPDGKTKVTELPGTFDFRLLLAANSLEVSLNTPDGNIVFFLSQTQAAGQVTSQQGFIGSNGTWVCNFEAMTCDEE